MQPSMIRSAVHALPREQRSAFSALHLLRLALSARRLAGQTLLASALLVRSQTGDAAAQEQLLPGPIEHWDSDGNVWEFSNQGQYFFPEGDYVFVPGLGYQTDDVQIPNPDGSPAFDLQFVPFDDIPMSALDGELFGGSGSDYLAGGESYDALFGGGSDLLETYEQSDGSFFDSIDGLAGDIDFVNPPRDFYDLGSEESGYGADTPASNGAGSLSEEWLGWW